MLNSVRVDVTDFKRFSQDLRTLEGDAFKRGLQPVLKRLASKMVPRIQARYDRRYPAITGGSRGSIRASGGMQSAAILAGNARQPHVAGQEFGSDRYPQFRPYTGRGPGGHGSWGRFVYPTIREELPGFRDELMDEIME